MKDLSLWWTNDLEALFIIIFNQLEIPTFKTLIFQLINLKRKSIYNNSLLEQYFFYYFGKTVHLRILHITLFIPRYMKSKDIRLYELTLSSESSSEYCSEFRISKQSSKGCSYTSPETQEHYQVKYIAWINQAIKAFTRLMSKMIFNVYSRLWTLEVLGIFQR